MSSLLVASDDSDFEAPSSRTRRIFNKVERVPPRYRWLPVCHSLFLLSLSLSTVYLAIVTFRLHHRLNILNDNLTGLILLPSRLSIVENDLHRLKMQFDLMRESQMDSQSNGTKSTTEYVHDQLEDMRGRLRSIKNELDENFSVSSEISRRVRSLEVNFGSHPMTRDGEKQRRREAERRSSAPDDIVFKRDGQ